MNYNNHTITAITYNNHTIKRAYACNGELVFGEPPVPPSEKMHLYFDDGGSDAIVYCNSSTTITINEVSDALHDVERHNYNGVTNVTFSDCVTTIEPQLLGWTAATGAYESLTGVTIPSTVTTIGFSFCQGRTLLTDIEYPSGVTVVAEYAFYNCSSLANFQIKEGVTTIGTCAFDSCSSLKNITIPSTVTSIGQSAFHLNSLADTSGRTVTCLATTPPTLDWIVFETSNGTATYPIYVPSESLQAYKTAWSSRMDVNRIYPIPYKWKATYTGGRVTTAACDSTSAITTGEIDITDLIEVEIGDCVTGINYGGFINSSSLSSCTIGNNVTSIGQSAFYGCSNLTNIGIPSGVTSIGSYAFMKCRGFTSIYIPSGVTNIESYAFNGCSNLSSITVEATTPPTLGLGAFDSTNNCPIYVPAASVSTYQSSNVWSQYASRIQSIP